MLLLSSPDNFKWNCLLAEGNKERFGELEGIQALVDLDRRLHNISRQGLAIGSYWCGRETFRILSQVIEGCGASWFSPTSLLCVFCCTEVASRREQYQPFPAGGRNVEHCGSPTGAPPGHPGACSAHPEEIHALWLGPLVFFRHPLPLGGFVVCLAVGSVRES